MTFRGFALAKISKRASSLAAVAVIALLAASAQAAVRDTIDVVNHGDGTIGIQVVFGDGTKISPDVPATNGQTEEKIAENIAAAANLAKPGSATVNGRVVSFAGATNVNILIVPAKNGQGKLAAGADSTVVSVDLPVGVFSFDPSLADGGTVLTTSAQISAGFTNGLLPISFNEPAATDINLT